MFLRTQEPCERIVMPMTTQTHEVVTTQVQMPSRVSADSPNGYMRIPCTFGTLTEPGSDPMHMTCVPSAYV